MIDLYLAAVQRLSRLGWHVAQALIALAIIICCGNALSRKFFDLSSNAFLEAQWYCFGAAFLLAGSQVMADNAHVRIDALASRFSQRTRLGVDMAGLFLCVLPFCLYMCVWSWPMFAEAWARNEMSADAGGLVRWPVKLMIPLGFGLLGLQTVAQLVLTARRLQSPGGNAGSAGGADHSAPTGESR